MTWCCYCGTNYYHLPAKSSHEISDVSVPKVQSSERSLQDESRQIRREIITALHQTGGGHYGGALSVVDMLAVLYRRWLRICPAEPDHPRRDRLVLSKGHAAIALYAWLRKVGLLDAALSSYGGYGSPLQGHPDMLAATGVDFSTGSLGQGLSVGLGMALATRDRGSRVFVILGDGECQEGQVWEAAMLAPRYAVGNLCAIVDNNGSQEWGWAHAAHLDGRPIPRIRQKWEAFGWDVYEVDGHDYAEIDEALGHAVQGAQKPSVLIAHTRKGCGVSMMERAPTRFHCASLTEAEYTAVLAELDS